MVHNSINRKNEDIKIVKKKSHFDDMIPWDTEYKDMVCFKKF